MYQAGDNDLKDDLQNNLEECEKIGSSPDVNIVSQFDRGGTQGCDRLYVKKNGVDTLQKMGDVDMADPQQLSDFIQWGIKNYPARHVMLVISDHGDAWRGAINDDGSGKSMSLPQIEKALSTARQATGKKLDVLGFDACLMANAEVADQLKNEAAFMVASEETEGESGWPYNRILSPDLLQSFQKAAHSRRDMSPQSFAHRIVGDARGDQEDLPTLSAFDMSQVPALTSALRKLTTAEKSMAPAAARAAAQASQKFDDTNDLYDFADHLATANPKLKRAADAVKQAVSNVVLDEQHSADYPGAHGISIDLSPRRPSKAYQALELPSQTGWGDMLASWQGAARSHHSAVKQA
jgi:hypothetical protein